MRLSVVLMRFAWFPCSAYALGIPFGLSHNGMVGIISQKGKTVKTNLAELIDKASEAAGSDSKLAKLIEATQPHISEWRRGTRACPPGDVALMAHVAGLDAGDWTLRAVAAKYEGTAKGEMLMQALKIGSSAAEPARTALETMAGQLDDMPEVKQGILAVLNAFPPELEKLKSTPKARRSTRRG